MTSAQQRTKKGFNMTVTISRLYDNYSDAQRAVTSLEAAGLPHSD